MKDDTNKNKDFDLPLMALDEIPYPKKGAKSIVALKRENGTVTGYQLSDGKIVSKQEGVLLAKQGEIKGVAIATNKGTQYLKSVPDKKEQNNLGNLPSIS